MARNKKDIEVLSISEIKKSISLSEYLDPYINDNDKEPSWDGSIYVYNKKSKKKKDLIDRVPVQIKGTENDNIFKKEITFSMSTDDLKNYLTEGCILFVVYIESNGINTKIYYSSLLPVKLVPLLKSAKEQKTKTIHLKEFPTDNKQKVNIFLNFIRNRRMQSSFVPHKFSSLEEDQKFLSLEDLQEYKKQGIIENMILPLSSFGFKDSLTTLINDDSYLYAKVKGCSIPQPLNMILKDIQIEQSINVTVTIENRLFYKKCKAIKDVNGITCCLGNSFIINFSENIKTNTISYKNSDKVRILAQDLDFMLTCLEYGYFKINNNTITIDYNQDDFTNFDVKQAQEDLKYAKNIVKVLDTLNCSDDINIKDMSEEDWRNINYLITAFVEKKSISGLKEDLPPIGLMNIGKLKFALYIKKDKNQIGTYNIYNFFKTDISVLQNDVFPISQFFLLHENELLTLNNIDFNILFSSFKNLEYHKETFSVANNFLLRLLNAYDKATGQRKYNLLKTCDDFSKWILTASDEELDYQIRIINRLQTIKRIRKLNADEINILYELLENNNLYIESRISAALLLDQQQLAKFYFSKLDKIQQDDFKKFPIYHYWKMEDKKNG